MKIESVGDRVRSAAYIRGRERAGGWLSRILAWFRGFARKPHSESVDAADGEPPACATAFSEGLGRFFRRPLGLPVPMHLEQFG